jgi:hypothetical protein
VVQDTGKTLRTDTLKPVNLAEPVLVEEDSHGLPVAVRTKRRQTIIATLDRWRIDDEWWRSVSRLYYSVLLASGQKLVLSKNLTNNRWYRQSY